MQNPYRASIFKPLGTAFLSYCFFGMLYWVVLTFQSVYQILKCDHSNESYWAVLSYGAVYYAVQGGSTFESAGEILKFDYSNET